MILHGTKSYLTLASETTWGTTPLIPTYYHCPVTAYGVTFQRDRRNAAPLTGLRQRKQGRNFRGLPAGSLVTNLHGWKPDSNPQSLAEYLLTWAFGSPEETELPSKLAEWAEGPDVANTRHLGLRVNSAVLEGSADTGVIKLTLELMGRSEEALETAQALPDDREKCVEMDFADCTFELGGSPIQLRGFRWQVANNLAATYLNTTHPAHVAAGQRVETLTFQTIKVSDAYSAFNRAFSEVDLTGQLTLKGLHNGTGSGGTNYTVGTVDFSRLAFVRPTPQRNIATLVEEGLVFDVLKPDTTSEAVTVDWSEVA